MSLQELWQLFPIILTPHQPCWKSWYLQEAALLRSVIPQAERISHIGSTAIAPIWAKPIVDILVELPKQHGLSSCAGLLESNGYICMAQAAGRLSFNKGYTPNGFAEKVFHLHLRHTGDNDELYFRDYLMHHPDAAAAYQQLKLKLWHEYEHDRDGYTAAKSDFVQQYTAKAKCVYAGRY